MRTKQTDRPKPEPVVNGQANGTPKTSNTNHAKSPAQLHDLLTDAEKEKIRAWLDRTERPFNVTAVPMSRKRKRNDAQALQIQDDLFDDRLSVQYEVKPRDKWESLRRYKKFTVGSESIATGQCILVKHDDTEATKIDIGNQWKGKVLEVRALDSEHVYIRVAWLNRPEDLESGRKDYHGKNELIPTNEMDIIDAMAVNGSLDVLHWDDGEDESPLPNEEQYFWRQTYDHANSRTYSKLRLICKDNKPQNPDETIIQCSNEDCRKWLHVKCIAEEAVQEAAGKTKTPSSKKGKPKHVNIDSSSSATAKAAMGSFTAEVFIKGLPDGPDTKPATETEVVITDADGEKHSAEVQCLICSKPVE